MTTVSNETTEFNPNCSLSANIIYKGNKGKGRKEGKGEKGKQIVIKRF